LLRFAHIDQDGRAGFNVAPNYFGYAAKCIELTPFSLIYYNYKGGNILWAGWKITMPGQSLAC